MLSEEQHAALRRIYDQGPNFVIGVDEVGYGSLAGPVTVGAAVLPARWSNPRVRDSKDMTHEERVRAIEEVLNPPILAFSIVLNHPSDVVDKMGVTSARDDLALQAVTACRRRFPDALVVMDGVVPLKGVTNTVCLAKADALVPVVSAASILAKEDRDACMEELHELWPVYGFKQHKGYGTAQHVAALNRWGPCAIHRFSYRNVQEVAKKFDMHASGYAKPSPTKSQPARISGWRPLPSGMRVSTNSNKR